MSRILRLLTEKTGFSLYDLTSIASSGPKRYKTFEIPKRSGGMREIAQPARELKIIQRILVKEILEVLPVHSAATAYRKGLSIRHNALMHGGMTPILKMDFKDFFPSLVSEDWIQYCKTNSVLDEYDIALTVNYFFRKRPGERKLRLSIGAPSSPCLSNILLYDFDKIVHTKALEKSIIFSRYADDITFSGQRIGMLKDMQKVVENTIKHIDRPEIHINSKKTTFITSSFRRSVTGLVIDNSNGTIGIGHAKKRQISAAVHHAGLGKLAASDLQALCGQLAFINVAEPQFLQRLKSRYGLHVIRLIQKSGAVGSNS